MPPPPVALKQKLPVEVPCTKTVMVSPSHSVTPVIVIVYLPPSTTSQSSGPPPFACVKATQLVPSLVTVTTPVPPAVGALTTPSEPELSFSFSALVARALLNPRACTPGLGTSQVQ